MKYALVAQTPNLRCDGCGTYVLYESQLCDHRCFHCRSTTCPTCQGAGVIENMEWDGGGGVIDCPSCRRLGRVLG